MHCESLIQPLPQKHICAIGCIHDSHCKNCATFLHLQYRCLDAPSGIADAAKLHSFLESAQRCFELGAPAAFFELRLFISSSANDHGTETNIKLWLNHMNQQVQDFSEVSS